MKIFKLTNFKTEGAVEPDGRWSNHDMDPVAPEEASHHKKMMYSIL